MKSVLRFIVVVCMGMCLGSDGEAMMPSEVFSRPEDLLQHDMLPWTLSADKIQYIKQSSSYVAEGHVVLQSGERTMKAERATFHKESGTVTLEGDVLIQYGEDWIRGERVVWHIERQSGYVERGRVYFTKNHFYIEAERIEKRENDEYIMENGFVTTCLAASDWTIHYKYFRVPLKGMAEGRSIVFRAGSVPIVFIPWAFIPVTSDRQSGFLRPTVGFSSLNGMEIEIPYYWAIDAHQDATFFGDVLQRRGVMGGVEYRWSSERWGDGILLANYLDDYAEADHLRAHGFSGEREDRYWIRGRAIVELPEAISARLNLDVASDGDFLREFSRGSNSYEYTDSLYRSFLGTGLLADKNVTVRENNVYLFKRWENAEVSLDLHYWDENDPTRREMTAQELPSLGFSVAPSKLDTLPLYYALQTSLVEYWRDEGSRGTRVRMEPRLSAPVSLFSFLNTDTVLALNTTLYNARETASYASDGFEWRVVPSFTTGANVRMERRYEVQMGGMRSLLHSVSPEVRYEYVPKVDEGEIPSFDQFQSPYHTHRVRYGLTSFITATYDSSVQEWGRVSLFQYYRFGEQRVSFFENGLESPTTMDNGFSDMYLDLNVTPLWYLDLAYTMAISPHDASVRQHDAMFAFHTLTGQWLNLDYRYREGAKIDEIIASFQWDLRPWLSVATYHNYSFAKDEMFKHGYSVTYRRDCWAMTLSYEREGEDQRFFVSVNLLGLGHTEIGR